MKKEKINIGKTIKGIFGLLFGPDILDETGHVLRKRDPYNFIYLILS